MLHFRLVCILIGISSIELLAFGRYIFKLQKKIWNFSSTVDAAVVPFLHILKCSEQSTWSKSQKIQVSHYEDLNKKVFCLIYLLALWLTSTTTGKILNKVFDLLKCAVSLFEFKLQERGNVILQHGAFLLNCFTLIQTNSWKVVGNFF